MNAIEFLDYMFSAYLSSVMLMEALERRSNGKPQHVPSDPAS